MSAATTTTQRLGVLSRDAERVLAQRDCFSAMEEGDENADVYTSEGDCIVTVTPGISAYDLSALLRRGEREYNRGYDAGRCSMQEALRTLINAAPLEPTR